MDCNRFSIFSSPLVSWFAQNAAFELQATPLSNLRLWIRNVFMSKLTARVSLYLLRILLSLNITCTFTLAQPFSYSQDCSMLDKQEIALLTKNSIASN